MRARDAEDLMARALTCSKACRNMEGDFAAAELVGLKRARPIYAEKKRRSRKAGCRERASVGGRVISALGYWMLAGLRLLGLGVCPDKVVVPRRSKRM